MKPDYDVVIIGGGPAGLSAALIAGRARRRVVIIDSGAPRNSAAPAMHSYLSRDGILPRDFRTAAHEELAHYATVERREGWVDDVHVTNGQFRIQLSGEETLEARKVVLALGVVDHLPMIEGLASNWGNGVHHCPFCDGFEHRDRHWGVLAEDTVMLDHARFLRGWAGSMTVLTNGFQAPANKLSELERAHIKVISTPLARVLVGDGHSLGGVVFSDGKEEAIESLWIRPQQDQTPLIHKLALPLRDDGAIARSDTGETSVSGLYAVGDCGSGPMQQAILAAADGARVMIAIVHGLMTSN